MLVGAASLLVWALLLPDLAHQLLVCMQLHVDSEHVTHFLSMFWFNIVCFSGVFLTTRGSQL